MQMAGLHPRLVGRGNNEFVPYGNVTRAEAATMFFRLLTGDFRNY